MNSFLLHRIHFMICNIAFNRYNNSLLESDWVFGLFISDLCKSNNNIKKSLRLSGDFHMTECVYCSVFFSSLYRNLFHNLWAMHFNLFSNLSSKSISATRMKNMNDLFIYKFISFYSHNSITDSYRKWKINQKVKTFHVIQLFIHYMVYSSYFFPFVFFI